MAAGSLGPPFLLSGVGFPHGGLTLLLSKTDVELFAGLFGH